jgi:hypothetical protein
MLKYFFLILLIPAAAMAVVIVPNMPEGQSSLLYQKDGYIFVRKCSQIAVVNSKSECKSSSNNKEETKLMTVAELKVFYQTHASRLILDTRDMRLHNKSDLYKKILSNEERDEIKKKIKAVYQNNHKSYLDNLEAKTLDDLNKIITLDNDAIKTTAIIEAEIEIAIQNILSDELVKIPVKRYSGIFNTELSRETALINQVGNYFKEDFSDCTIKFSTAKTDGEILGHIFNKKVKYELGACHPENCTLLRMRLAMQGRCKPKAIGTKVTIDPTLDIAINNTERNNLKTNSDLVIPKTQDTNSASK